MSAPTIAGADGRKAASDPFQELIRSVPTRLHTLINADDGFRLLPAWGSLRSGIGEKRMNSRQQKRPRGWCPNPLVVGERRP
jgi:hypothetical protein